MKKLHAFGAGLSALTLAVIATSACAALKDGTYETTAMGNNGEIVFQTTIKDGRITSVQVVNSSETPLLGQEALSELSQKIVDWQTINLDAVSGASKSSAAILQGVNGALIQAGGSAADLKSIPVFTQLQPGILPDVRTDVVVVGAGGSGMAAAIEAKNRGARVILIEKQPNVGGTTLFSTTSFTAGGSKLQMQGVKPFTAEDFHKKLLAEFGEDSANLKQLADRSGPTIDWLIGLGADLTKVINDSQHVSPTGKALGTVVVPVLKKEVDRLGIDTRLQTKAENLVLSPDGKVTGVVVRSPNGRYTIHAASVILATGGFASNPDMVAKYTPQWAGYPSTASRGSTGDGLVMAQKAGAALSHMDVAGPQTVAYDTGHGAVSLTNVRYNGAIIVNRAGKRFVNELGNKNTIGLATKAQPEGVGFLIFDQTCLERGELLKKYKAQGYFVEAPTVDELASKLGIDAAGLKATLKDWAQVYATKTDKAFGRKDSIFSAIDKAPFYGQKTSPANQVTFGGVTRDTEARALTAAGKPIEGLYVSGETADQFGHGVSIAITTGRIAGEYAAKHALGK